MAADSTPRADRAGTTDRIERAMAFLQEAVYRSREAQARAAGLAPGGGSCGLGEKAAVVLDLSERGEELFGALWPDGLDPEALENVRAGMSSWVQRQDALDRKRNHFMKDFRHRHGFDRTAYDAEQAAAWESGLHAVNGEVRDALRKSAEALLGLG